MTHEITNELGAASSSTAPRFLLWTAYAAVIALLLGWSAMTVYGWQIGLRQTADLDYSEGWHAYCAQQATGAGRHVGSAKELPLNVLPYPPLAYILNGAVGKALGGDLTSTRNAGRYIALTFSIVAAVLILMLCRMLRVRWSYALFVSVLFLNLHSIQLFAISLRPDSLALSLTLFAVYLALRFNWIVLSGALLALAVFAKHSYVTAPAVMFWGYVACREWKSVYRLTLGGVLATIAAIWLATWALGSHWLDGPLLQGFHGAKPGQVLYLTLIACRGASLPLAIGLVAGLTPGLPRPARFLHALAAVSFILNVIAMVKPGASMNYLLEPTAFALVLVAFTMERGLPKLDPSTRAIVWLTTGLALLLVPALESAAALRAIRTEAKNAPNRTEVIRYLRDIKGPILATESWMYFDTNHESWVDPSDLVSAAVEGGIIPEGPMLEQLQSGHFAAIAMTARAQDERPFPKAWAKAIDQNYAPERTFDDITVFLPKPEATRKAAP